MLTQLRKRISTAHVISIAALFIALGGMAWAATKAPKNSVVSSSIKKGAVKKSDLNKKVRTEAFQTRVASAEPGGTFDFDASDSLVADLPLQKGSYVISSTFEMVRDAGLVLRCQLRAGGTRDQVEHFTTDSGSQTGALGVAHKFGSNGTAELRCLDGSVGDNSDVNHIEIIATKVTKVG